MHASFKFPLARCGVLQYSIRSQNLAVTKLGGSRLDGYSVSVGVGKAMAPEGILGRIMRVDVKVAVEGPTEFIVIT